MLKAILTSLDGVDDAIKGFYTPIDDEKSSANGKFRLNVEAVDGHELDYTDGLKRTVTATRQERDALQAKLAAYGELDPGKARDAIQKVANLTGKEAEFESKIRSVEEQLKSRHAEELLAVKVENEALISEVQHLRITSAAKDALREHKGSIELLLPHVTNQCRLRKNPGGQFVVEVVDAGGQQRIKNGYGDNMTIADLVAEMKSKDVFARAFEASGTTGSGQTAAGAVTGGASKNPWAKGQINFTEQMRLTKERPDVAARLKAEAGVR